MTQRDIAAASGVRPATINAIELGQNVPQYRTIRKIADALGVEPRDVTEFAEAIDERSRVQRPRSKDAGLVE